MKVATLLQAVHVHQSTGTDSHHQMVWNKLLILSNIVMHLFQLVEQVLCIVRSLLWWLIFWSPNEEVNW